MAQLDDKVISDSLVICDVRVLSFHFNSKILDLFKTSTWIIEVHESDAQNGAEKLENLILKCSKLFKTILITTGARDLSHFPEIELLPDDQRWLICSDARGRLGKWLILEPLS